MLIHLNFINCLKTILICLTIPVSANSQTERAVYQLDSSDMENAMDTLSHDSLKIKYLFNQVKQVRSTQPKLALSLLKIIEDRFTVEAHQEKFLLAYQSGVVHKNLGNYDLSEKYLLSCLALDGLSEQKLANVHMVLSNLHKITGYWEDGMIHATKALDHYEVLKDSFFIINALSSIGYFLNVTGQIDQGIEYHQQALRLSKLLGSEYMEATAYSNLGLSLEKKELLDSALYYHQAALNINIKTEDKLGTVYDYLNIGRISLEKKDAEYALDVANKAMTNAKVFNQPNLILASKEILGSALVDLGQYDEGITMLEQLMNENEQGRTKFDSVQLLKRLFLAYKSKHEFKQSLAYMERYNALEKEMNGIEASEKVNELEIKYETEKKASEIQLLQLEKELDQQKIIQTNRRFWLALISGLILSLLLLGLYRLYRKSKVQEKALGKMLTEKEILLREVHHRVKNNLQLISSILNLQYVDTNDEGVKFALQEGQNRVMSMSYIHQQLYQNDDLAEVDVKLYFKKLIQNLFESYNTSLQEVKLDLDIDELLLDLDTLIPLGLILNELISNSLKHAFVADNKGVIQVKLKQLHTEQIMLSVADDGDMGKVDLDNIKQGSFGLRMVQAFSTQLGGQLEVDNSQGTCFTLLFNDRRAA